MTVSGEDARPGGAPDARGVAGTMFAALCGELTPRLDRDPGTDRDPYIQFHDRSLAMGWLDSLWDMNDAGQDHPLAAPGSSMVTWFQVGVGSVPGDRPLPAQPFLRCAADVTARLGTLRLQAVQMLLPAQKLDISARPQHARIPSLLAGAWFDDVRSTTRVRVTVDSGQNPAVAIAALRIHEWTSSLDQNVFDYDAVIQYDPVPPPFPDTFWNGPPLHRVTFEGTLVEWSLDAIGWLGGFVADLAAREGAGVPLLLTVSRM